MTERTPRTSAAQTYAEVASAVSGRPGVEHAPPGRKFGSGSITVAGRIAAMQRGDHLVVKVPRQRVEALIAEGTGEPFESGRGKPMREWVAIPSAHAGRWRALVEEAIAFASK